MYHILPYITGGLDRLIHRIKTQSVPELAGSDGHTVKIISVGTDWYKQIVKT